MPEVSRYRPLKRTGTAAAAIVFVLAAIVLSTPRAGAEEPPEVLSSDARTALFERLKQVQSSLQTFQAHFVELRSVAGLQKPIRYEGMLYFEKDRLFFMHYETPVRHILCVRGAEALMYVEGSSSADVMRITGQGGLAENAAFLAWEPGHFTGTIRETEDAYLFEETGAGENNDRPALTFALQKNALIMKHLRIDNLAGDITDISFSSAEINALLPEEVRHFSLPKGVSVNDLTQP